MKKINQSMGLMEWILLLSLAVLWGGSFFFVEIAVESLPPLTLVALRVSIAAIALNLIIRFFGLTLPKERRIWVAFIGMGLLNNFVPFTLIVWGQSQLSGGLSSIFNATTPLFTVIAAHLLTQDEKMTPGRVAGVLIGFAGVVYMIGPEVLGGFNKHILAQLAILAAALSYALAGIFGRRFQKFGIKPIITATGQITASTILLLPVALIIDQPWTLKMPTLKVWGSILGIALLSTALAYILYFRILASAGATNVLLVTFLIPVVAILLGTTFLGEHIEFRHIIGMGFIGAGLCCIDGRLFKILNKRNRIN